MFRSHSSHSREDEENGEELSILNASEEEADAEAGRGEGAEEGHHGADIGADNVHRVLIPGFLLNICLSKRFLKALSIVVGCLGLLLTVVLIALAYANVVDTSDSTEPVYVNQNLPLWVLNSVQTRRLQAHVQFLSGDLLQGRGVGTVGEDIATDYVQAVFRSNYLEIFNDNSSNNDDSDPPTYVEPVPLYSFGNVNLTDLQIGESKYKYLEDFIATSQLHSSEDINITNAQLVFAGYGIESTHFKWSDFKDVDVKGKIIVVLGGAPLNIFNVTTTYTMRWTYKFSEAQRQGALGILVIHTDQSAGYGWSVLQSSAIRQQVSLDTVEGGALSLAGWVTNTTADAIAKDSGSSLEGWTLAAQSADFKPVTLPTSLSLAMRYPGKRTQGKNVVGLLKGKTHPDEYIVVMAHHDHLGTAFDPTTNQTKIFHGAIDNASGVSLMLEISSILSLYYKVLSDVPAVSQLSLGMSRTSHSFDRSIVFVSTTAEEDGLLGALHFLNNGPIKQRNGSIVGVINFDVVNVRDETNDTIAFGLGLSPLYDQYLSTVCAEEGMYVSPDPRPALGFLYRNDQLNFLLQQIPALTMGMGAHFRGQPYPDYFMNLLETYYATQYHQPSDAFSSSWSFKGTAQQVRIASRLAFYLASSATARPTLTEPVY